MAIVRIGAVRCRHVCGAPFRKDRIKASDTCA